MNTNTEARRKRILMKRIPLEERLAAAGRLGLSPANAACIILDVAAMPLDDYFADIKTLDNGYLEFLRRLRAIDGAICDKAGFTSDQVDGSTTVARMAVMLRGLLDACPMSLRQHSHEECDLSDGIMLAVEWFSVPLERAFEEFDQNGYEKMPEDFEGDYGEPFGALGAADAHPKSYAAATGVIDASAAPRPAASEPAAERIPLERRLSDARCRSHGDVVAYGLGSQIFRCAHDVTMSNLMAGYQLLVGVDAAPSGPVANAMFVLGLDSDTVPGCALSEQTLASDPNSCSSMGTPDLSDYMDHDRDLHVVAFVRPMAALADCGWS